MRILGRIFFTTRRRITLNSSSTTTTTSTAAASQILARNRYLPNQHQKCQPYSTENRKKDLVESSPEYEEKAVQTTVYETIKEGTKTASYLGVIIVGVSIGSVIIYAICSELFSNKSPNRVYSKAFAYVAKDSKVQNVLGDQIKGFGEETRRGRRQHVSHVTYHKDGLNLLRMKFYVKGSRETGTVHLEMYENEKGKYEYRYLFVVVDDLARRTIILEDNRAKAAESVAGGDATLFPSLNTDTLPEVDLSMK